MRDKLIQHKLAVDKIVKSTKKEMDETFQKVVFTNKGYKQFKKNPAKFLQSLMDVFAKETLEKAIPKLFNLSEGFKKKVRGV